MGLVFSCGLGTVLVPLSPLMGHCRTPLFSSFHLALSCENTGHCQCVWPSHVARDARVPQEVSEHAVTHFTQGTDLRPYGGVRAQSM